MAKHEPGPDTDEFRDVAQRSRSFWAAFRMTSGAFRARVASALDAAARLEEERNAIAAARRTVDRSVNEYRATFDEMHARLTGLAERTTSALEMASVTERNVAGLQERALSLDEKTAAIEEEDRRLLALSEDLGRTQHEARALLSRVEDGVNEQTALVTSARETEEAAAERLAEALERLATLQTEQGQCADRVRDVSEREGSASAIEEAHARERAELEGRAAELTDRDAQVSELIDRVERDQAAVNVAQERTLERLSSTEELERTLENRFAEIEQRHRRLDTREESLAARTAELDEVKLALDRERVEVDGSIERLKDLERRDEQLLQIKSHLDQEKRRVDEAFKEVRGNQRHTLETWDQLKESLARLERLETRVQETYEKANEVREASEQRAEEVEREQGETKRRLDERSREIEMWRMEAQLRERRIQARFNELDTLEQQKEKVREQIAELERAQAERIAAFEREQQQQRALWGDRRAEAEKARELYERNVSLLDRRIGEVVQREKEHAERAAELETARKRNEKRERELAAIETRVHELEEQRQSLNATIAGLTARAGTGWSVGEGIGLGPAAVGEGDETPAPATVPAGNGNGKGKGKADGPPTRR